MSSLQRRLPGGAGLSLAAQREKVTSPDRLLDVHGHIVDGYVHGLYGGRVGGELEFGPDEECFSEWGEQDASPFSQRPGAVTSLGFRHVLPFVRAGTD